MARQPVTFRASEEVIRYMDGAASLLKMNRTEFILWALTEPARLEVKRRLLASQGTPSPAENSDEPPTPLRAD